MKQFNEMDVDEKWAWLNSPEYFALRAKKQKREQIFGFSLLTFAYSLQIVGIALMLYALKMFDIN